MRRKPSQNVHTKSCLHREPGVTICCCWLDLEPVGIRHRGCPYYAILLQDPKIGPFWFCNKCGWGGNPTDKEHDENSMA